MSAPKVTFTPNGPTIHGKAVQIKPRPIASEGFELVLLGTDDVYATCDVPGRLSEVANNAGALTIRHDYDMVAEHYRFHR